MEKQPENNRWKKLENNFVLTRKGYYVSYVPNMPRVLDQNQFSIGALANQIGVAMGLDAVEKETALVIPRMDGDNEYYILSGDFRKKYEKAKTLKEAKSVYNKNRKEFWNNWSTNNKKIV